MVRKFGFSAIIFAAAALIWLGASMVVGGSSGPLSVRKDPVVVEGKQLPPAALGAKIESYRLFASRDGALKAIPLQIDEFDKDGLPLVRSGPKVVADSDNGAFDANDQLAFMARDMGSQSPGAKVDGCGAPVEIAAQDTKSGTSAYAYLFKCDNPPPLAKERYVKWDAAKRTVITDSYKFGWHQKLAYYYDYITIGDGPDILDRLKVRITVGLGGLRKTFTEENFIPTFFGVNDGPVRVMYRCDNKINLGGLGKLPIGQNLFFYDTWCFFRSPIDSRFNPAIIGLDFEVAIELDLALQRSRGYKLCSQSSPDCPTIDGVMTPAELDLAKKELTWGGIIGPEGGHIIRLLMDKRLTTRSMGIIVDDDSVKDPPEYIPGSSPVVGFRVVDWKKTKSGIYDLDFYLYFIKNYTNDELKIFDKIALEPLKITAK